MFGSATIYVGHAVETDTKNGTFNVETELIEK